MSAMLTLTVTGLAGAQTTTTSPLGPHDCGQRSVSFLFWPSGHGASTQYSFPAFPTPHVEVYTGAPYQNAQFLAYFSSNGGAGYATPCTPAASPTSKVVAMKSSKQQTANALIVCTFKKNAILTIVPGATSSTMSVVANNASVMTIELGATSSTAKYDGRACVSKPPIA